MSAQPKIRADLVYTRDPADESYYFVKDPIRSQFFRFNELQVELMRSLDGRQSLEQIAQDLSDHYETEIPPDALERVLASLRRDLLLEVSSYKVDSEADRRLIRKALAKTGLVWRGISAQDGKRRALTQETVLFQAGLREIEHGDPCESARYFAEVLAVNPRNKRAREIYDTIQAAFFGRYKVTPWYLKTFHVWDPDSFLAKVDQIFGRFIFSPWFFVLLFVVFGAAMLQLPELKLPDPQQLTWTDGLFYIPMMLLCYAIHELSHGLACKHYGGEIRDIGLLLFYGVAPGAYSDTSDSYTFANKYHKVAVSMAGTLGSTLFDSLFILIFVSTSEAFIFRQVLAIRIVLGGWSAANNFIPFIKRDGYYALADYLEVANLRERSFKYLAALASRKLFGVELEGEKATPREKRIFLVYGISAMIFTVAYVYGLWISVLLVWAVEHLGMLGLIITAIYLLRLTREIVWGPGRQLAKFIWTHKKAIASAGRLTAFAAAAAAIIAVLSIRWPFPVEGDAVLEPEARALATAAEAGQLVEILVKEGDWVEKGQLIAVLKNEPLNLSHQLAEAKLAAAEHRLALAKAGSRKEEIALAKAAAQAAQTSVHFAAVDRSRKEQAANEALLKEEDLQKARRTAQNSAAEQVRAGLALAVTEAGTREEDIAFREAEVEKLRAERDDLAARVARLEIKSPVTGRVVGERLQELRLKWLAQGETFCEVHDLSRSRIEVTIPPAELVGKVSAGQQVVVRMYGDPDRELTGKVERVFPAAREGGVLAGELLIDQTPDWPAGLTGRARIYGEPRTLAYRLLGAPIVRLVGYDGWRLWGS